MENTDANMLCLLESHDMLGFINGLGKEKVSDYMWKRSDALVKGWILGSLSEQTLRYIVNLVTKNDYFTAKDAWDKLKAIYGPALVPQQATAAAADLHAKEEIKTREAAELAEEAKLNDEENKKKQKEEEERRKEEEEKKKKEAEEKKERENLYEATLSKSFEEVDHILRNRKVKVTDKITINGNTALHVAVGTTRNRKLLSKEQEFLEKLLNLGAQDNPKLDMKNSEGSTLLHVAAIVGNTETAKILMTKNQDLLFAKDIDDDTPLNKALSNMHTDMFLLSILV